MSSRKRLGSLLVSAGLLEAAQLSRALDAQLQFEGRLGTNLIELGLITEDQLSETLGKQHGVPWASAEELRHIAADVVRRLPKRAARMYRAIPLAWDEQQARTIRVAMTDPGNLRACDELSMLIGARVQPVAAAELRIAALLEQHYGISRPQRFFIRVVTESEAALTDGDALTKKNEAPTAARPAATAGTTNDRPPRRNVEVRYLTPPPAPPSEQQPLTLKTRSRQATLVSPTHPSVEPPRRAKPSAPASDENPVSLERPVPRGPAPSLTLAVDEAPPTVKMAGLPSSELEWDLTSSRSERPPLESQPPLESRIPGPPSAAPESTQQISGRAQQVEDDAALAGKRHLHAVLQSIAATDDRDEAAAQVLGYLSQSFVCAFVLVVKAGVAYGWKGYAPGATEALIESIVVPLSAPSVFQRAHDAQSAYRGALPTEGARIHTRLWKMLGCEAPSEALVIPVSVGPRLVNLIYAHPDPARRVKPVAQANLVQLASALALAYRRAIRAAAANQVA